MLAESLKTGPIWALGTMSGTSLDGVDAAMVLTDGADIFGFGATDYRPYSDGEREVLHYAMGLWTGAEDATRVVESAHAELLAGVTGADLVGFHGQTVAHDPGGRGTRQIGDGARLAHMIDAPVAWDFRSADVAMGGQGAPLAPFFHHACARWIGAEAPLVFLNLGGVGNLTWVDPACVRPTENGACLAFDTGPANAPLNDFVQARRRVAMDADGALARTGTASAAILDRLSRLDWFRRTPPKSLDRNDFAWLNEAVEELSDADGAATLTMACVQSAAAGLEHCPASPARVLVTGGGRRNGFLMERLSDLCPCPVEPVEAVGLDGDMLEAQAFAYLAVRTVRGWPLSAPSTTGASAPVTGGRLSWPDDLAQARRAG